MDFLNVGFGNLVSAGRIVGIVSPDSAPVKRLAQDAKENGSAVDCCCGKKCRAVLIMDSGHIILSAWSVDSLGTRLTKQGDGGEEETV